MDRGGHMAAAAPEHPCQNCLWSLALPYISWIITAVKWRRQETIYLILTSDVFNSVHLSVGKYIYRLKKGIIMSAERRRVCRCPLKTCKTALSLLFPSHTWKGALKLAEGPLTREGKRTKNMRQRCRKGSGKINSCRWGMSFRVVPQKFLKAGWP